jgi:AcrR family transcriptional regulator
VRDIADDAGVNVALINRYFESKEGLFAACLAAAVDDLRKAATDAPFDTVPDTIATQVAVGDHYERLLLLVRSSGDERADQIRVDVLRSYGEGLAARAGWRAEDPDGDDVLLRAQLVLGTAIGAVLLRSSGLQPLASADEQNLAIPLRELVNTMLRD